MAVGVAVCVGVNEGGTLVAVGVAVGAVVADGAGVREGVCVTVGVAVGPPRKVRVQLKRALPAYST